MRTMVRVLWYARIPSSSTVLLYSPKLGGPSEVSLASWVPKTLPCHYKICWLREGEVQGGISLEKERFSSL
jgi:hypothetical protein